MSERMSIKYIANVEIDRTRWDTCIKDAPNGLIYAYSYYLDNMARYWDALVAGDYEIVMPLTYNKKYGIYYLYQPFLTAQLGIFGKEISAEVLTAFLAAIPAKFRYADIYLNHNNIFAATGFDFYFRSNYVLNLNKPYSDLYKSYRENTQRNIKKATQLGCIPIKNFDVEKVIELAVMQMKKDAGEYHENINRFRNLYKVLSEKMQAITYGMVSEKSALLASAVFFYSNHRAYYILVGNHPNGKTIGASHALIDAFIKDHADRKLILDFEGSDIRNLAFFYSSFGAVEEKYTALKINRLPFYLKWLKS
jgi:hypothetical protein